MKEELLMDYLEGRLGPSERAEVERHLAKCDDYLEAFLIAEKMPADENMEHLEPVPGYLTARLIKGIRHQKDMSFFESAFSFIRSLVARGAAAAAACNPWRKPGLAPVRGTKTVIDDSLIAIKKSFTELDVAIEIDKIKPGKANIKVALINHQQPPQATRVTLFNGEREVSSYLVRGSQVRFENVFFGHYTMTFTINGVEKGNYSFEIKETRHGKR